MSQVNNAPEQTYHQSNDQKARRTKKRRTRSKKKAKPSFFKQYRSQISLVFVVVLAVLAFINPLEAVVEEIVTTGSQAPIKGLIGALVLNGGNYFLGAGLVILAIVLFFLQSRKHRAYNQANWPTNCPDCDAMALKRTPRNRKTYMKESFWRLPYRRYICTNCSWKGDRIDPNRLH